MHNIRIAVAFARWNGIFIISQLGKRQESNDIDNDDDNCNDHDLHDDVVVADDPGPYARTTTTTTTT